MEVYVEGEGGVGVGGVEVGGKSDVGYVFLVTGVEVAVAGYAGKSEEVLVFEVRAVAPAEYL